MRGGVLHAPDEVRVEHRPPGDVSRPPARRPRARYGGSPRAHQPHLEPGDRRGRVFGLELPLDQAANGYRAMDQRQAIKALLRP